MEFRITFSRLLHPGKMDFIHHHHHPPPQTKANLIIDLKLHQDATGSCSTLLVTRFTRFSRRRRAAKPAESLVKVASRVASWLVNRVQSWAPLSLNIRLATLWVGSLATFWVFWVGCLGVQPSNLTPLKQPEII